MMKKWVSLLLAMIMLFTAGAAVFAESEEDGDDSVQIPVDGPEDDEEEQEQEQEQEGTSLELRPLTEGDEGDDVLFLQMRLKNLKYFEGEADGKYGKDTQNAVLSEGAATRAAILEQTNTIVSKLCEQEIDNLKAQNLALQNQVNMQNLAASQAMQTQALIADNTAQTQYIVNRVAPYPIPAYVVANPVTPAA